MHALRRSSLLARLVLAWFVLAVGAAMASPLVQPKSMALVCSASGGIDLVVTDVHGTAADTGRHAPDCALCLPVAMPPAVAAVPAVPPSPLAHALRPAVAAHLAALAGAPLPARGPPQAARSPGRT